MARLLATAGVSTRRSGAVAIERIRSRSDSILLATVVVLTAVAQPHLFAPATLVSLDTASQFYPWYTFLGENLSTGHVAGWNPAIFSGAPFAANPLSGWTYLPAMLLFTLLPMAEAARGYLLVHPLLAGCSTLALARILGMGRAGAAVAGIAYANTGFLQVQNVCCFAFASVYAWLPMALLGAELAIRSCTWRARGVWWSLAGLAISQIFAAWLGQGAYYASMLIGAYIAYRTLFAPTPLLLRMRNMLVHASAIFLFGVALDAAGLLPRLEFNTLSTLAGGYTGAEASVGGLHPKDWLLLGTPGFWYAGLSVLALAAAAPFLVRGSCARPCWFFGAASVLALLLTGTVETPLHWLLYHVLPGFSRLHPHAPERILTVAYLGPALLAGATVSAVLRQPVAAGLVLLVVLTDLGLGGAKARDDWMLRDPLNGADKLTPVDLATYYAPDPAATFLQQRLAESPSRFIGYAPYLDGKSWPYSTRFMDPATAALQVDNRALSVSLQDVQGYDASHLDRYDEYIAALNGHAQNYHDAEIFLGGLQSPLLDVLNVRFVIVPARGLLDGLDANALARFPTTVYEDGRVRILENPAALPRAWIVHSAAQAAPDIALASIADGLTDPRQTALLEEPPPILAPALDPSNDQAVVTVDEPDRLTVTTTTDAAGLLVLSEIDYPAWHGYVDGSAVRTYTANGALRAVPVTAGQHTVELRFESSTLQVGMMISAWTALGMLAIVVSRFGRS